MNSLVPVRATACRASLDWGRLSLHVSFWVVVQFDKEASQTRD
jgi:hypothetical protein